MTPDLSVCRDALDLDPVRYLDMTEPVRLGRATVLDADPDGALVQIHSEGRGDSICSLFARTEERARALREHIPPETVFVICHETCSLPALAEHPGCQSVHPCWQAAWLGQELLPLPRLPFVLRPLTEDALPQVTAHYTLTDGDYLRQVLHRGELLGAFDGDALAGFIGLHAEGTMGLLEVLPAYRRRGLATLLLSHLANTELARGHVPYCQTFQDNEPSLALQRSLGFCCAKGPIYWVKLTTHR